MLGGGDVSCRRRPEFGTDRAGDHLLQEEKTGFARAFENLLTPPTQPERLCLSSSFHVA